MANSERLYEVIRKPLITEKATNLGTENKMLFEVSTVATKNEIKSAIEMLFNVSVEKVNTSNLKGKTKIFRGKAGKRKDTKKAVVTLKEGHTIDLASGVQ